MNLFTGIILKTEDSYTNKAKAMFNYVKMRLKKGGIKGYILEQVYVEN